MPVIIIILSNTHKEYKGNNLIGVNLFHYHYASCILLSLHNGPMLTKLSSSVVYYAINLTFTATTRNNPIFVRMSTSLPSYAPKPARVTEKSFDCSDGVRLAARYWTNIDAEGTSILCFFMYQPIIRCGAILT